MPRHYYYNYYGWYEIADSAYIHQHYATMPPPTTDFEVCFCSSGQFNTVTVWTQP